MSARDRQVGGDHYNSHAIQPWDVIDEYGLSFYAGCALKYLLRDKGGRVKKVEDLSKAIHCLEKEKERLLAGLSIRDSDAPAALRVSDEPMAGVATYMGERVS